MIPTRIRTRLTEAIALHEAGRLDRAEVIYRAIAQEAPRCAVVFELLGRVAEQQGRFDEAISQFRHALRLEPGSVSRAVHLAGAQIARGQVAEAEQILRQATVRTPRSHEAWNSLGFALKILGRLPEALQCHERAVLLEPSFAEGWLHWGLTLTVAGHHSEALEKQERALALNPRLTAARFSRAQLLYKLYRGEEALRDYDAVIKAEPQHLDARSYRLFALQALEHLTPRELAAEHRAYGKLVGCGPDRVPGHDCRPQKRLRVAIHSPDFRTHSCAYFIEPLLRGLDRDRFELYLYHEHFIEDETSRRLRALATVWRNFVGQPAAMFEKTVRSDAPDILIDLTGHVGNRIRLPSFAKRLAPVQITYLGYPDTTGVPAMDFRFTDAIADPPGESDELATEQLVRFSPVAWAYQPPACAPAVSPPPVVAGTPLTFGCFSAPTKFTDSLFRAWAQVLAAVPGSRLMLKGGDFQHAAVRERMLARLARCGVPSDQLVLLPRTPDTASHLAQYAQIDIALDTFPYAGTTTACEALWMGRPLVTLRGNRHAARVAASLVQAVGHPEWVAESAADYVRIARELASDPHRLASLVANLRAEMTRSPLLDHDAQAARFASALVQCWQARVGPSAEIEAQTAAA